MKALDLAGVKCGRLTPMRVVPYPQVEGRHWLCKCDCGGTAVVRASYLSNGTVRSCGCMRREHMEKLGRSNMSKQGAHLRNRGARLSADDIIAAVLATDPRVILRRLRIPFHG